MNKPVVFEITQVKCYGGAKGEEHPLSFVYSNRRVMISEILDRWYENGVDCAQQIYNYFKIKSSEGVVYLLRNNIYREVWSVKRLDF